MYPHPNPPTDAARLRRRAEARLRGQEKRARLKVRDQPPGADPGRMLHELEVHQVELEMQNAELQRARDQLEVTLEKYTDLYDFAPVGYFSLNESGVILEANLMGAALLGVARSQLLNRRLPRFAAPASQPVLLAFLKRIFAGTGNQICEAALFRQDTTAFWASLHGIAALTLNDSKKWCRVAVTDITDRKRADEVQRRVDVLAASNQKLERQIVLRRQIEQSLKQSEERLNQSLAQSRLMQEQLRLLSRQILSSQEEERKRISRELHDVIAQTLTGISIRLATLKKEAGHNTRQFSRSIARTQQLVEHSVNVVHRFARELRPAVLDDLGLVPALLAFMKNFTIETGVRAHLTAFAHVEQLDGVQRTVLFRVAQEALNNVARHAHASRVDVSIQKLPHGICMKIKDDGKSFRVEPALRVNGNKRLGLLGMKERLEMVGGNFRIHSAPGQGTTIEAQIPLPKTPGAESQMASAKMKG
jgi:PAS domain S-box-containing protein